MGEKITLRSRPQPPAVGGGGGRGEMGIIMPLWEEGGVWETFGDKLCGNT
jgi:hypothetical protein